MAIRAVVEGQVASVAEAQLARVDAEGSSRHPHLAAILTATGAAASRDLADAVHLLCAVHGRHPGLTDGAVPVMIELAGCYFARRTQVRAADLVVARFACGILLL